jgi:uncharacterized phage-associated protein
MASEKVYDSRAVADYLIRKSLPRGLDPLQVMKLTYIAHGFTFAVNDKPLLEDDVEAWKLGPVVRRVYNAIPGGARPITESILPKPTAFDKADKAVIDSVFDKYGQMSGLLLSSMTHRPGSPWFKTWQQYGKNAVIPQDLIDRHYKNIMADFAAAKSAGQPYYFEAL